MSWQPTERDVLRLDEKAWDEIEARYRKRIDDEVIGPLLEKVLAAIFAPKGIKDNA